MLQENFDKEKKESFLTNAIKFFDEMFTIKIAIPEGEVNKEWCMRLLVNAEELLLEAEILGKYDRHRRSLFLILSSFEQIVKAKRILKKEQVIRGYGHKHTLSQIENNFFKVSDELLKVFKKIATNDFDGISFTPEELQKLQSTMTPEAKEMYLKFYKFTNEFKDIESLIRKIIDISKLRNRLLYEDENKRDLFREEEWIESINGGLESVCGLSIDYLRKDISKLKLQLSSI